LALYRNKDSTAVDHQYSKKNLHFYIKLETSAKRKTIAKATVDLAKYANDRTDVRVTVPCAVAKKSPIQLSAGPKLTVSEFSFPLE
jgi:hypothetical protein